MDSHKRPRNSRLVTSFATPGSIRLLSGAERSPLEFIARHFSVDFGELE